MKFLCKEDNQICNIEFSEAENGHLVAKRRDNTGEVIFEREYKSIYEFHEDFENIYNH